jgi:hypothetical protein
MKSFFFIIFFLVTGVYLLPSVGLAQDSKDIQTVETQGTGLIVNNDIASGRNIAIRDALRKAVERVVVSLIPSKTVVKKAQAIRDSIYAKSDQYIHDYRIISEKENQSVYSVNMRATIFAGSIKDDLQKMGLLRIEEDRVPATGVAVTVHGIKSCADYMKIVELLKTKVAGVRYFYPRRFELGMAKLDVDIQGTVQSLTDELAITGHFSPYLSRMNQSNIEVTYSQ